jgi:hypothetical protein
MQSCDESAATPTELIGYLLAETLLALVFSMLFQVSTHDVRELEGERGAMPEYGLCPV